MSLNDKHPEGSEHVLATRSGKKRVFRYSNGLWCSSPYATWGSPWFVMETFGWKYLHPLPPAPVSP